MDGSECLERSKLPVGDVYPMTSPPLVPVPGRSGSRQANPAERVIGDRSSPPTIPPRRSASGPLHRPDRVSPVQPAGVPSRGLTLVDGSEGCPHVIDVGPRGCILNACQPGKPCNLLIYSVLLDR